MRRLKDERMRERKIRQKTDRTKRSWTDRSLSLLCVAAMLAGVVLGPLETTDVMASESVLTCTQAEHTHGDGCYQNQLTCGKNEHTHGDGCFNENGEVVCGQEEHGHTGDCYTKVLACTQAEHTHSGSCYTIVEPETTPQTTAETTPQTTAETTAQTTAETTPQTTAETTAQTTAETTAQTAAETTPQTQESIIVESTETVQGTEAASESETAATELKVSATTDMKYAVAGKDALTFTTKVSGGTAPLTVKYEIKLDGKTVYEQNEYAETVSWMPTSYGEHTLYMTVTDAAGKTTRVDCTIPVSVNETENGDIWKESVQSVTLTGEYGKDIAAIAKTQIGTKENKKNFIINKEGKKEYYSRYGQWYGDTYEEWSAMFVSFCAEYAGIPASYLPREKEISKWIQKLGNLYESKDGHTPEIGDLVFFSENTHRDGNSQIQNGNPSHVGIVIDTDGTNIWTVEGNCGGAVAKQQYSISDGKITGYVSMDKVMELAGKITVSETEAEEDTETESELESESEGLTEEATESQSETEETTQLVPEKVIITTDDVNLRAEPTTDAEVIAVVDNGTELDLLGAVEAADGIWYRVNYVEAETAATEETGETQNENATESQQTETSEILSEEVTSDLPVETAVAEQTEVAPAGVEAYVRSDLADVVVSETEEETPDVMTYEDDEVVITVIEVAEGAIPENATLQVVPLKKDDTATAAQYAEVEANLLAKAENEEYDIAGFLAYDITFVDENGEKLEPNGEVKVSMDYKQPVIPQEVAETVEEAANNEEDVMPITEDEAPTSDSSSQVVEPVQVTVMHLEENASGEVQTVVDMAESSQLEALDTTADQEIQKAEFVTESFSTYTITWKYGNFSSKTIWIRYEDDFGNDIPNGKSGNKTLNDAQVIDLESEEYKVPIENYVFEGAFIKIDGESIQIRRIKRGENESTIYYSTEESGENWKQWLGRYSRNGTIYMVYSKPVIVHYVDTDGKPIAKDATLTLSSDEQINMGNSSYKLTIDGYSYYTSKINSYSDNGISIVGLMKSDTSIQYMTSDEYWEWKNWSVDGDSYDVYMIYEKQGEIGPPINPNPTLGVPDHQKYIKKNTETDDYTLSLDVTGKIDSSSMIDILLIIDASGSMASDGATTYKNVNDAIDALKGALNSSDIEKNRINFAVATFNGPTKFPSKPKDVDNDLKYQSSNNRDATTVDWTSYDGFSYTLESSDCNGGTNWQAGIRKGNELMSERIGINSAKYVIFLTDGNPTFRYYNPNYKDDLDYSKASSDYTQGYGTGDPNHNNYKAAVDEWRASSALQQTTTFVVDAVNGSNMCDEFATIIGAKKELSGTDKNAMEASFKEIAQSIINPGYSNVYIEDTLSEYVDFVDDGSTQVTAYKVHNDGTEEQMDSSEYSVSINGKTVRVDLLNGGELEQDVTYRIKFNVKTTVEADYEYYSNGRKYYSKDSEGNLVTSDEVKGDAGTDAPDNISNTSSGQRGFHSNESALVGYTETGMPPSTASYKHPVVQVKDELVSYAVEKVWVGPVLDSVGVELKAKVTIGDKEVYLTHESYKSLPDSMTITLSGNTPDEDLNWKYTWSNLPKYYYYVNEAGELDKTEITYSAEETNVPNGYESSYDRTDPIKTVITNTFNSDLTVNKVWSDGSVKHNSDRVYVGLFKKTSSSEEFVFANQIIVLDASTKWTGKFEHLESATYIVKELRLAETNETASYTVDGVGYMDLSNDFLTVNGNDYKVSYSDSVTLTPSTSSGTITVTNTLKLSKIEITKVDSQDENILLKNATFELQKLVKNGDEETWEKVVDLTTNKDGKATSGDLENGTYQLIEKNAPEGYMLNNTPVSIIVDYKKDEDPDSKQTIYLKTIKNSKLYSLPSSGGPGTYLFTISGVAILMTALLLFITNKRKEKGGYQKA